MHPNQWEFHKVSEHQQWERRRPQSLERHRLAQSVTSQPSRIAKQTGRLLNALGNGMVSLSRRLDTEWDVSPETPLTEQEAER